MKQRFKAIVLLLGSLACSVGLLSSQWNFQTARASSNGAFINELAPEAQTVSQKYNLYPSLMLAQAALESGYGRSALSTKAYNYFGVKGSYNGQSTTMRTAEYGRGGVYYVRAKFKKYPNAQSSFEDYARLIRNGVVGASNFYSGTWRENTKTVNSAATALVGKYATDPNYAIKLIRIINQYQLTKLDVGTTEQSNDVANANGLKSNVITKAVKKVKK